MNIHVFWQGFFVVYCLIIVNTRAAVVFLYDVALCGLVSIEAALLLFTVCILHGVVSSSVLGGAKKEPMANLSEKCQIFHNMFNVCWGLS